MTSKEGTRRDEHAQDATDAPMIEPRELLAAIVESSEDAIISKSLHGTILSWNAAAERLFGYTAAEMIGTPIGRIIPPERQREEVEILARLRQGERLRHYETVRVTKSGERLDISLTISPIRDAAGRIVGASKVARDITAQKRAQRALRESEARFRLLADAAPVLIWMSGPNKEGIYFNQPWLDFTGKPLAEQVGDGWIDAVHPEDRDKLDESCRAAFRERRSFTAQFRLRNRDGEYRWMLDTGAPRFGSAGHFLGFIGTCVDITDRKRAEEALRESEERFRALADNMVQLAWMADASGWIFWYNERWFDYTGTTLEQMEGWGWQKVHHPDHVQRVVEKFRRHVQAGETWEDTFPLRGQDGNYRWFLSRAFPIRDGEGKILRWFGTNTDITERMQMEEALKEADRRKDEFLAMLAHELRNPLAPIRSGLDVLATGESGQQEIVELMQRQVDHVVRLVDDLLDMSRIMRGRIQLRKQPIELSAVLRQALDGVRQTAVSHNQEIAFSAPERPVWLNADPVRLAQIFENLLHNASKYTDAGGRIELAAERDNGEVVVRVRDNGIGIEPDLLPKVFDLFTQSSRSLDRAQGGLGIGLTLVKNLVEMHGGIISAESEGVGKGSTFVVRLPVGKAISPGTATAAAMRREPVESRRILVVDDNEAAVRMLSLLLSKHGGHEVELAYDGESALAKVHEFRPDMVLLDIGLPGMDGYQVGRRIRENPEFDGLLLVALTGYGQEKDRQQSREAGFDEHLVKPPGWERIQGLLMHPKLARK